MKGGRNMNNKILVGIIIIGILLVGGYLFTNTSAEVSAQGTSSITVQPDKASVYISAEAHEKTAQAAKDKQAEINNKVVNALIALGFSESEIQTSNYNIYQEYDWSDGQQKPKGFVATQQIVVKTTDFKKVAPIVDAAVDNGALISSINFELSPERESDYKAQALTEASEDARKKAEATANGLGKNLGRLISVESQNFQYYPWAYYSKGDTGGVVEARDAALSITPQSQDITASVSVRYKLGIF